ALTTTAGNRLEAQDLDGPRKIERAAIVAIEVAGDAPPSLSRTVDRGVGRGLGEGGVETTSHEQVTSGLRGRVEPVSCTSTTCLAELGRTFGVGPLVRAEVVAQGADYPVELELFAAADGALIGRTEKACPVCTVGDLARLLTAEARRLVSSPQAADAAATPPALLVAQPAQADTPPRPLQAWKWAAAGGAVLAVAGGAYLVAIDDGGTCDGDAECDRLYDTRAAGWTSIAVGVGLAGGAAWMFYRDR